jgi:hypothetical protein
MMGTDDIFKKSKAKRATSKLLKRQVGNIDTLKRVLVVSEGKKTEPIYFDYLVSKLKLTSADIEVMGSKKSCPLEVVKYAKELFDISIEKGIKYDMIFCVIDRDTHFHYGDALSFINTLSKYNFYAINSVPCFEYWLLLHFAYTTKPFSKTMNKSICEALISDELKKYLPNYEKNISLLEEKQINYILDENTIKKAIEHSKKVLEYCDSSNTDNPSTRIHEMVEKFLSLKESKKELLK